MWDQWQQTHAPPALPLCLYKCLTSMHTSSPECSEDVIPPYTQAVLSVGPVAANSRSTCFASSLVGASTMQPGDLGLCVRAMSFSTTGSANARVLPDPVLARPIKSRPIAEAVQVELDPVLARPIKSRPVADAHANRVIVIELQKKRDDYARSCSGMAYQIPTCSRSTCW